MLTDSVLLGSNSSLTDSFRLGDNRPAAAAAGANTTMNVVSTSESIVLDQSYYPTPTIAPNTNMDDNDEIVPSATSSHLPVLANVDASPMLGQDSLQNYSANPANQANQADQADLIDLADLDDPGNEHNSTVPVVGAEETLSKTPLLRKPVILVGTHDGRFHADEVMGVTFLKILYDLLGEKIQLFRSRDPDVLNKCDIVLDVGQVYDPSKRRFDHHQKSCSEIFYEEEQKKRSRVLLSSAGMTWKEFGKIIVELYLSSQYGDSVQASDYPNIIEQAYHKIYNNVVKETDAHDNGQSMIYEECDKPEIYRYKKNLDHGNTIAKLNNGVSKDTKADASTDEEVERRRKEAAERKNNQFVLATELTELTIRIHMDSILEEIVREVKDLPVLKKLFDERKVPYLLDIPNNVSSDPKLISKVDVKQELLYTVYYQEHSKVWSFGTMQVPGQQFVNRKNLLSIEALKERLTPEEFADVIFVHKNLFCGSAKNHDLAVKICMMSGQAPAPAPVPAPTIPAPAPVPATLSAANAKVTTDDETDNPNLRMVIMPAAASIVLLFIGYKLIKYALSDD